MTDTVYTFKISLFATKNIGKDTLIKNYFQDRVFDHGSMIARGVVFASKALELYGKDIRNQFWIYSSEERFRILFRNYISGSNGVILMYDITNAETLNSLSEWCQLIKNNLDYTPPMLLVGNKLDLEENRKASKEQVEIFREKNEITSSMEISLKTGENVEEMFMNITRMVMNKHLSKSNLEVNQG